ncbi:MAG: GNAT family N-acetyltransferase [Bacteriovoracaceae bacterium]|nr:GNAT family N-acetyltransferase [Bacteriovoracaceae bacterium]
MSRFKIPEEIHTERLLIRKHQLSDAGFMFKAIDEDRERLRQWLPWVDQTKSLEDSKRNLETCLSSWENQSLFDYGFYSKSGKFLGRGGLHSVNLAIPKAEFGYWMTKDGEGKGYVSEAISAIEAEFFKLGFERLEVRCDPLNIRSANVPKRLGYRLEAILSREARQNGKLRDTMVWAKLKNDHRKDIPKRPSFIGHWSEYLSADDAHYPNSQELLSQGSPIGNKLGLKAIGVHVELLHPGRRTSWPHAESSEEEFAFVLEGTPDAWIDGILHRLVPGDFVAFPSGTGIAHTFLNNTKVLCKLLVGGESSKPENKIHYPLHPKRNEEMKQKNQWWNDAPKRDLGSHDGIPQN